MAPAERDHRDATEPVLDDLPFGSGDKVLLFVNGMGGTPLSSCTSSTAQRGKMLEGRGIR